MTALTTTPDQITTDRAQHYLNAFIADQDCKPKTKQAYQKNLHQFFTWLTANDIQLSEVTREDVITWKGSLIDQGKSTLTVSTYLSTIRRFFEWSETKKYYPNIAKGIKAPKRKQGFRKYPLVKDQAKAFIKYFETKAAGISNPEAIQPLNITAKMHHAIISLLIRNGLRTCEVIRADIQDLQIKGGRWVLYVQGKGYDDKGDCIVLKANTLETLNAYINVRGDRPGALFQSTSNRNAGGRLTTKTISQIAKEGLRAIGLDQAIYTAHSLRHTCAYAMRKGGASPEQTQAALRHANINTTQLYDAMFRLEDRLENPGEDFIDY